MLPEDCYSSGGECVRPQHNSRNFLQGGKYSVELGQLALAKLIAGVFDSLDNLLLSYTKLKNLKLYPYCGIIYLFACVVILYNISN